MDDNKLIKKYLDGDESAFKELYNKYKLSLFSFIYHMVKDKELADDIFQDVFIKVIDNLDSFNGENFKAWLFLIARNTVYDWLKSNKKKIMDLTLSIDDENINFEDMIKIDETPEKNFFENYEREILYKAIDMLNENDREIIYLKHFSDLSFNEISIMLKVPIGTLLSRFKRAIEKLAKIISAMQ